ncbi:MAG: hypothetical protein KDA28_03470, partial [Phycisphaerales bacterium]|nr:hypothetical protein [Phycisphaerales bacterium]
MSRSIDDILKAARTVHVAIVAVSIVLIVLGEDALHQQHARWVGDRIQILETSPDASIWETWHRTTNQRLVDDWANDLRRERESSSSTIPDDLVGIVDRIRILASQSDPENHSDPRTVRILLGAETIPDPSPDAERDTAKAVLEWWRRKPEAWRPNLRDERLVAALERAAGAIGDVSLRSVRFSEVDARSREAGMSDSWVPEFDTTQLRLELVSSDGSTFSEEFPCGIEWSTSQSPSLGVVAIGYDALVEARSLANDMPDATMKELRQILSKRRDSSQSKTIDVLGLKIELLIPRVIGPLIILVLWILLSLHLRQARHDLRRQA